MATELPSDGRAGIAGHYERLSETYDTNWEYSSEFISWMTDRIYTKLMPKAGHFVADVGGGTGLYSKSLRHKSGDEIQVVCVDPSAAMLSQISPADGIQTLCAAASDAPRELATRGLVPIDRILIKEAVHHFSDIQSDLGNLIDTLTGDGVIVLIMLPPTIDYPLFRNALELYERLQPHFSTVETVFADRGLRVETTVEAFPLKLPVARYREMVQNRYMSLLSNFSDADIARGLQEMSERKPASGIYEFEDRFIFIAGSRGS